MESRKGILYLL